MSISDAEELVRNAVFEAWGMMLSRRLWNITPLSDIGGRSTEECARLEGHLGIVGITGSWTLNQLVEAVIKKNS